MCWLAFVLVFSLFFSFLWFFCLIIYYFIIKSHSIGPIACCEHNITRSKTIERFLKGFEQGQLKRLCHKKRILAKYFCEGSLQYQGTEANKCAQTVRGIKRSGSFFINRKWKLGELWSTASGVASLASLQLVKSGWILISAWNSQIVMCSLVIYPWVDISFNHDKRPSIHSHNKPTRQIPLSPACTLWCELSKVWSCISGVRLLLTEFFQRDSVISDPVAINPPSTHSGDLAGQPFCRWVRRQLDIWSLTQHILR